jgi:hypothetical protein
MPVFRVAHVADSTEANVRNIEVMGLLPPGVIEKALRHCVSLLRKRALGH